MGTGRVTTPDGQTFPVTIPDGVDLATAAKTIDAHFTKIGAYPTPTPAAAPGAAPIPPDTAQTPTASPEMGMAARTWNAGQSPDRSPITKMVQGVGDTVLPGAMQAPLIATGGGVLGQAGVSGALGAGKAALEGKSVGSVFYEGAKDALVGLGGSGAMKLAGKAIGNFKLPFNMQKTSLAEAGEKIPGAKAGYDRGTAGIDAAIESVRAQLPAKPFLQIPEIAKGKLLTLDELKEGLKKLNDPEFSLAARRAKIQMDQWERGLDKAGTKMAGQPSPTRPYAGSKMVDSGMPDRRFVYEGTKGEKRATGLWDLLSGPKPGAVVNAGLTQTGQYGDLAAAALASKAVESPINPLRLLK